MNKFFIYIFIAILVITNYCNASMFDLSNEDKNIIKNSINKRAIAKRFINTYKFIKVAKSFSLNKKLLRTNIYINKIISRNDDNNTNKWSTPKEFLINGYGDCEDYAIAKYFILVELGINRDKLFLSVVKIKGSKNFHMVLMYLDDDNIPLILDNLSWKVLDMKKRLNFNFKFAFNEKASYTFNDKDILTKETNINRGEVKLFKKLFFNKKN